MSLEALWLCYDCRGGRGTREDAAVTGATSLDAWHAIGEDRHGHAMPSSAGGRSGPAILCRKAFKAGWDGRVRSLPGAATSPPRPPLPGFARRCLSARRSPTGGSGLGSRATFNLYAVRPDRVGADPWDRLRAVIVGIFGAYGPSPRGWHGRPPHCLDRRRLLRLLHAANGGVQRPAGGEWTPTFLKLFCFWLWETPSAWILAFPAGMAPTACSSRMEVSFSTLAVVTAVLFKRGKWKQVTA